MGSLPVELLQYVALYLPYRDVTVLCSVCPRLDNESFWRFLFLWEHMRSIIPFPAKKTAYAYVTGYIEKTKISWRVLNERCRYRLGWAMPHLHSSSYHQEIHPMPVMYGHGPLALNLLGRSTLFLRGTYSSLSRFATKINRVFSWLQEGEDIRILYSDERDNLYLREVRGRQRFYQRFSAPGVLCAAFEYNSSPYHLVLAKKDELVYVRIFSFAFASPIVSFPTQEVYNPPLLSSFAPTPHFTWHQITQLSNPVTSMVLQRTNDGTFLFCVTKDESSEQALISGCRLICYEIAQDEDQVAFVELFTKDGILAVDKYGDEVYTLRYNGSIFRHQPHLYRFGYYLTDPIDVVKYELINGVYYIVGDDGKYFLLSQYLAYRRYVEAYFLVKI